MSQELAVTKNSTEISPLNEARNFGLMKRKKFEALTSSQKVDYVNSASIALSNIADRAENQHRKSIPYDYFGAKIPIIIFLFMLGAFTIPLYFLEIASEVPHFFANPSIGGALLDFSVTILPIAGLFSLPIARKISKRKGAVKSEFLMNDRDRRKVVEWLDEKRQETFDQVNIHRKQLGEYAEPLMQEFNSKNEYKRLALQDHGLEIIHVENDDADMIKKEIAKIQDVQNESVKAGSISEQ